jgi:hypothetical protein
VSAYRKLWRDAHYGNVVIGGQISFNGTAALAKWRLQHIVTRDREAAPTYRWVRRPVFSDAMWLAMMMFPLHAALSMTGRLLKPRFRLERRR